MIGKLLLLNMIFKSSKIILKAKCIIILPLLSLLLYPTILYAFDEVNQLEASDIMVQDNIEDGSFFRKTCNNVYQFVNEHEYLFVPLSAAMAGEVRCGIWCAAVGGTLGAVDEIAIYFGLIDKRYLTWGIFGITTGHMLNPSMASDLTGIAIGILLPTGVLNDHDELIIPVIAAMTGNTMLVLTSIVDEVAIESGITDKHYMTFLTAGEKVASKLLGSSFNSIVSNFIGMILGTFAVNYEEKIFSTFSGPVMLPVKTAKNLYTIYSKFIPKEQLNNNIEKQILALIGSQFLVQLLELKIIEHKQRVEYNFQRLDAPNGPAWKGFTSELTNFAIFLFPYLVGQVTSDRINSYFNRKTQYFLEDKIRGELFSEETAARLSNDHSTKVLTDNLKIDISAVTKEGSRLITEAVSSSINGVYGVGIIVVSSPDLLVYSTLYSQAQSFILNLLVTQQRFYEEKITILDSEIKNIMQYDSANIKTIAERDGMNATKMRLQQLYSASREYEANQEIWNSAGRVWWRVSWIANYVVNYFLVGNEIDQGRLSFKDRGKAYNAGQQVSIWLSWSGRNAQDLSKLEQSLNRIVILEGKIHAQSEYVDKISRTSIGGKQLILQDLEVGIGDNVLVSIGDLKLEMGKTYALDGKPGCGKSLLLSKIKGVKTNGIRGKGNIYYPLVNGKEPKIVMVSQKNYFPVNSSLQRIISWPDEVSSDLELSNKQKEEIQLLLKEIQLCEPNNTSCKDICLDDVKDWSNVLSGGEQKKLMLVSAIIKKPDILILDEVFAGLGSEATIMAQQMLKKYLPPHTLILVVDHEAQLNNYNHFYDQELSFTNKNIIVQDLK